MLAEAETAYEAANPGTDLTISTDSSAALETQIEQGAPADVFLSADTTNPQKLVDNGFAAGRAGELRRQRADRHRPDRQPGRDPVAGRPREAGVRIIAAGDEVPITRYATQLVENLAAEADGYPADFAAAYAANIVSKEDNVGASLSRRSSSARAMQGSSTSPTLPRRTRSTPIEVPDAANVPATYAGVVVGASPNQDAAAAFLDWLAGPDGQAVLSSFGFLPPP